MNIKSLLLTACLLATLGCDVGPDLTGIGAGLLTVNVTTSGSNVDPDGYLLSITGQPDEPVTINDTRTFSLTTTNVRIELGDVAANCSVPDNPVSVDVSRATTVAFFVECS